MFIDTWLKIHCPNCNKVNWINQGDTSDLTGFDAETFRCWSCKTRWNIGDEEKMEDDDDDCCFDIGLKRPK